MNKWDSPLAQVDPEFATEGHSVWDEIAPDSDTGYPGFMASEFNNPWEMDVHFLRWLYGVRICIHDEYQEGNIDWDVPLRINDDARPLDSDTGVSKSAHKKRPCRAVDLQVFNSYERAVIMIYAIRSGAVRLGAYPGKDRRGEDGWPDHASEASGLHIDLSAHEDNKSPRIWTGF